MSSVCKDTYILYMYMCDIYTHVYTYTFCMKYLYHLFKWPTENFPYQTKNHPRNSFGRSGTLFIFIFFVNNTKQIDPFKQSYENEIPSVNGKLTLFKLNLLFLLIRNICCPSSIFQPSIMD